jgi:glycosyltransferase involved in cell wall biosynthesis
MGILSATLSLGLPTALRGDESGESWDSLLLEFALKWKTRVVMINGFPPNSLALAKRLSDRGVRVVCVYHGSFAQHVQNQPELNAFSRIVDGLGSGAIARLGLVKDDMVRTVRDLGFAQTYPIGNMIVREDAFYGAQFSAIDGRLHIGVFGGKTLGKNVVTQIVAACTMPNAVVHVLRLDVTVPYLRNCDLRQHVPRTSLYFRRLLSQMDINLYASLHECQPMVALESMAAGVPCIISDTSSIYRADDMLQQLLVCPMPDAPDSIQHCLRRVIERLGPELSERARSHILTVNTNAARSLAEFLEVPAFALFGHRDDLGLTWSAVAGDDALSSSSSSSSDRGHARLHRIVAGVDGATLPELMQPVVTAHVSSSSAASALQQHGVHGDRGDRDDDDAEAAAAVSAAAAADAEHAPASARMRHAHKKKQTVVLTTYELSGANAGGAGTVIHALAVALHKADRHVVVLADMPNRELDRYIAQHEYVFDATFEVVRLEDLVPQLSDSFCGKAVQWAHGVERLVQSRGNIDVVEFFEYAGAAAALLARRMSDESTLPSSVQVVVRIHGSLEFIATAENAEFYAIRERMFFMERFAMHAADAVLSPSRNLATLYEQQCKINFRQLLIGAPPISASLEDLSSGSVKHLCRWHAKRRNRADVAKQMRFLIFGKLQPIKGAELVVRAAIRLLEQLSAAAARAPQTGQLAVGAGGAGPSASGPPVRDCTFTFVGLVMSPDYLAHLRSLVPRHLTQHFEFKEPIARAAIPEAVCQYDAGIVASRFESFNMVAHELAHLGLPLVISDFDTFAQFFNAQNAFVFRRGNVASLADAMARTIDTLATGSGNSGKGAPGTAPVTLTYGDPILPYDTLLRIASTTHGSAMARQRRHWRQSMQSRSALSLLEQLQCHAELDLFDEHMKKA